MKFENKVGGEFDNLAQRLVYSYIVSYSEFIPADTDEASAESQKQTHSFLSSALCKIYTNPSIIGLSLDKDDYFDNEMFKDRPELAKTMKNLEKKFLEFFDFIFELGDIGELKDNKLYISEAKKQLQKNKLTQLDQIGLKSEKLSDETIIYSEEYPELCQGLKFLINTCKTTYGKDSKNPAKPCSLKPLMFMRCIFKEKYITWSNLYSGLLQSGSYFKDVEEYFINNDFENDYHDAGFKLRKAYPNKQDGSFSVSFGWRRKNQLSYVIDVPNVRLLMEHFNAMDGELKELVFSRTKTCDFCGYCAQTGKREIVAVPLDYNGVLTSKCPYYPNFRWDCLDEKTISAIVQIFSFAENILL